MLLIDTDAVGLTVAHDIPLIAPEVAAEKLKAFPAALPILLLLIFIVVYTLAVLLMPVNPPPVAVEVHPRIVLLFTLSTEAMLVLDIPIMLVDEPAAPTDEFNSALLLMFRVATLAVVIPLVKINLKSEVPVKLLVTVIVLLLIVDVKVPLGAPLAYLL